MGSVDGVLNNVRFGSFDLINVVTVFAGNGSFKGDQMGDNTHVDVWP